MFFLNQPWTYVKLALALSGSCINSNKNEVTCSNYFLYLRITLLVFKKAFNRFLAAYLLGYLIWTLLKCIIGLNPI
jgi:hypothetical protein